MSENRDFLRTLAEQSEFRKTGRYDEVLRLTEAYAATWPDAVRRLELGKTPEGRTMVALAVSRAGALSAQEARGRKVPVLLLQGGIHPGESDGKDAGFMLLRELLDGEAGREILSRICVLFVPAFNVDGHERFGRWNRPNQVGPEEMGWRTTSQNYNLNRDYTKADSLEMQAMLRFLGAWDPVVYADLHVTNGADFEHDISIQVQPIQFGDPALFETGLELRGYVLDRLSAQGSLPLPFYPSFARGDDPTAGFEGHTYVPRYSTGYWAARNRFAVLVETHSWKDYPTRVRITLNTIRALAEWTASRGAAAAELARNTDAKSVHLSGTEIPLNWKMSEQAKMVEFRGYAYTREPSAISGALATRYDPSKPEIWHVPLRDEVDVTWSVAAPKGGYLVPAAFAGEIGAKLALHDIVFHVLDGGRARAEVETFRATKVSFAAAPFEGRTMATVEGEWGPEAVDIPSGSIFVPIAQPRARLVMALLEPKAPDSFTSWGFFNAVFERKEYMDAYVAEQVAREMLAASPELAQEFARKLDQDEAFARDPAARLDFFYRRHSSFDERLDLVPVYRVENAVVS